MLIRGKPDAPLNPGPEFLEIGIEPRIKAFLAQKPPVPFNQIELWRVGWQKEELYS
jgi:hypothetical protein